ncbi:hypothetical protein HER21_31980, partial [Pseudomonas sp. BGM005]|nr:hypothetical protein [Pseudomonas sp. BG5]
YVPLAQRCKRLGRYVIGVGVAGSTAKSLAAACDEFEAYDSLPGVVRPSKPSASAPAPAVVEVPETVAEPAVKARTRQPAKTAKAKTPAAAAAASAAAAAKVDEQGEGSEQSEATELLQRALRLGHDKADADEWLHSSAVKTHMRRMDPSFSEKALGYRSFSDFLKSR